AGLAERKPSSTDRRARIIAVTPAGAELAARSAEIVDGVHRRALGSLPSADRECLLRALNHLVEGQLSTVVEAAPARRARQ
ncbi:MAG: winged helix-turn-helix transcriptional regulator, partial [Nocardia sp.]|nr:winged helix-turn-helix transcriptional regulator [Nocardia sp.]